LKLKGKKGEGEGKWRELEWVGNRKEKGKCNERVRGSGWEGKWWGRWEEESKWGGEGKGKGDGEGKVVGEGEG
jgi:hypothetical protein